MTSSLDQLIYGKTVIDGQPSEALDILGISAGLTASEAATLRQQVTLAPMPPEQGDSQAVAVMGEGKSYVLARALYQDARLDLPVYQYIRLSDELLFSMAGHLQPLLALIEEPIPLYTDNCLPLDSLELPAPPTWSLDQQIALFNRLLKTLNQDMVTILKLLGAALTEQKLLIRRFAPDYRERVRLAQGLMMLLPSLARPLLTFSTNATDLSSGGARILFSDEEGETPRWVYDGENPLDEALIQSSPYLSWLHELWDNDSRSFIDSIKSIDMVAVRLMPNRSLDDGLEIVAQRHRLNRMVKMGMPVETQILIDTLNHPTPPIGDNRRRYLETLLHHALDERNHEAGLLAMRTMDADPAVEEELKPILGEGLQTQPDAVYALVRAYLSENRSDSWLHWLRQAASASVNIAIEDGDSATIISWLRLIAREPANYDLNAVLREAMLRAQPRAHNDGELGRELAYLAIKREPDLLATLLDDRALAGQLSPSLVEALCEGDTDALSELAKSWRETPQGREFFLAALVRAVEQQHSLTPVMWQSLWSIHKEANLPHLPEKYRPTAIIDHLLTERIATFNEEMLETLLLTLLTDREDDLFAQAVTKISERPVLFPLLADIFFHSGRPLNEVAALIHRLDTEGSVTEQQVVNIYIKLLSDGDWQPETQVLLEQLVRLLVKNPALTVSTAVLWKMLETTANSRMESAARATIRRLTAVLDQSTQTDAEGQHLATQLMTLYGQGQWTGTMRAEMMSALRHFSHYLSVAQLQKLDRTFEGRRGLEDCRSIIRTAIALRKWIAGRHLSEFAQAVATTFSTLEALSNAFDPLPSSKTTLDIDTPTIHQELESHLDELSPDARHVFAKNLKELAHLVTLMAENRSKASLIRSDETLDRQLYSGEHQPESAVDLLKWLSGYLEGAQNHQRDDES